MELFVKLSGKTELQECLDRDLKDESCGCALEEAPLNSKQEDTPASFGQPNKKVRFQVDLWQAWIQP